MQFITFVLSILLTNGFVKCVEGGDMSPILKEIAGGASSNGQSLFSGSPHPGSHGGDMRNMRYP